MAPNQISYPSIIELDDSDRGGAPQMSGHATSREIGARHGQPE